MYIGAVKVVRISMPIIFFMSAESVLPFPTAMDVSADLHELSRCPVGLVSAGVKSILDIGRYDAVRTIYLFTH